VPPVQEPIKDPDADAIEIDIDYPEVHLAEEVLTNNMITDRSATRCLTAAVAPLNWHRSRPKPNRAEMSNSTVFNLNSLVFTSFSYSRPKFSFRYPLGRIAKSTQATSHRSHIASIHQ